MWLVPETEMTSRSFFLVFAPFMVMHSWAPSRLPVRPHNLCFSAKGRSHVLFAARNGPLNLGIKKGKGGSRNKKESEFWGGKRWMHTANNLRDQFIFPLKGLLAQRGAPRCVFSVTLAIKAPQLQSQLYNCMPSHTCRRPLFLNLTNGNYVS